MIRFDHARASRLRAALVTTAALAACLAPHAVRAAEAEPDTRAEATGDAPIAPPPRVQPDVDAAANALFPEGLCDHVYALRAHDPDGLDTPYVVAPGEHQPDIAFELPWGTTQVQVVGWEPLVDNKKVLHHVSLYDRSVNIMGWSPGKESIPYPPDVGIDMPTRPGLRLDMHYVNNVGEPAPDRSGIALCIVQGAHLRPKSVVKYGGFQSAQRVMVPANTRGHHLTGDCTVTSTEPVHLLSVSPHAHLMMRHARLAITKPDGREDVLHDDSFSFVEQYIYGLETPYVLEPGDTVQWSCRYDNETNKNIGFGESTFDEMCILWAEYYPKGALRCR